MDFSPIDRLLACATKQGVFPGGALLVRRAGAVVYRRAVGFRRLEPQPAPLTAETLFDLASLTKPLATSLAICRFIAHHKLAFDDPVSRFLPDFQGREKARVTVRHLLSHTSGLPAWRPYFEALSGPDQAGRASREWVYAQIGREPLAAAPGQRAVYSDLGFILLGALVERLSGQALDVYCRQHIFAPLGLRATTFVNLDTPGQAVRKNRLVRSVGWRDDSSSLHDFAATERCPWRGRVVCGQVHDENAYAVGGVAGHAGLFSSLDDVDRVVSRLVDCYHSRHAFLPAGLLRECWTRDGQVPGSSWALGWDTRSAQGSSAGALFSAHSVGHLGFTGTSVWIDLERQVHVILLTNRVHPSRNNTAIRSFRPRLHDAVMRAVLGTRRGVNVSSGREKGDTFTP